MPNCGERSHEATSRVVNAKESKTWYPWMTFIIRYEPNYVLSADDLDPEDPELRPDRKPKKGEEFLIRRTGCTGSIISRRYVDILLTIVKSQIQQ